MTIGHVSCGHHHPCHSLVSSVKSDYALSEHKRNIKLNMLVMKLVGLLFSIRYSLNIAQEPRFFPPNSHWQTLVALVSC